MSALLLALDSVGIDPAGHQRPESVFAESRFLFPRDRGGAVLEVQAAGRSGILVPTEVVGADSRGAIECAITYTSIFSGQSAAEQHGLMRGLGLKEKLLKDLIAQDNLFRHFQKPCLANAIFPAHLPFFGGSFVEDLVPRFERQVVEESLRYRGQPVRFKGPAKNGFAELFTLAEINQNIFVHAAREAGMRLRTWEDVRGGSALSNTMTNELEGDFNVNVFGQAPLPRLTPQIAGEMLAGITRGHDFTFYKYQIPDLVSHTGRLELARHVFAVIERFVETLLGLLPVETVLIITSDHGHLEQLASSHAHPKTAVPTWYFGPNAERAAQRMRRPEGVFHVLTEPL